MSAFFVGKQTIDAAVTLYLKTTGIASVDSLTVLGKALWCLNAEAVCYRYADAQPSEYHPDIETYQFTPIIDASFEAILKATNCLLYQCNEGNIHETTLFHMMTGITVLYEAHTKTDEYDAAPWGLCG